MHLVVERTKRSSAARLAHAAHPIGRMAPDADHFLGLDASPMQNMAAMTPGPRATMSFVDLVQRTCDSCATAVRDEGVDENDSGNDYAEDGAGVDLTMPEPEEATAEPENQDNENQQEPGSPEVGSLLDRPTERRFGHSFAAMRVHAESPVMIQRWSVGGAADPSLNTIVCDGSGGVKVQTGGLGNAEQAALLGDCIIRHEESHKADALASNATLCRDKAGNSQLLMTAAETSPSEIKASNVEIACLRAKLPTGDAHKDRIINARITQMIAYRDSFH